MFQLTFRLKNEYITFKVKTNKYFLYIYESRKKRDDLHIYKSTTMNNRKLNIKDWAEEDRPREKLMIQGVSSLSDSELLAILIGSGNKDETAVELAQRILHSEANNLNRLGKLSINELTRFRGIGEAKAITIVAALELGKRRNTSEKEISPQVCHSKDIYNIMLPRLTDIPHEEVWILLLNQSNKIIKKYQVSKGGISSSTFDTRIVMKVAIDSLASSIILCHNHPSGNIKPSNEDDNITQKLKKACSIMDINLLDHVIIGEQNYYSYRDHDRI